MHNHSIAAHCVSGGFSHYGRRISCALRVLRDSITSHRPDKTQSNAVS